MEGMQLGDHWKRQFCAGACLPGFEFLAHNLLTGCTWQVVFLWFNFLI